MNDKGVTLVELITVIALIGILAAIGFISTADLRKGYVLKGAARQIYGDMQMARLRAVKEGRVTSLTFSGTSYTVALAGTGFKTYDIAADYKGVTVCKADAFAFQPNGSALSSEVIITNGMQTRRIYVSSSGTGNVRVVNGNCP